MFLLVVAKAIYICYGCFLLNMIILYLACGDSSTYICKILASDRQNNPFQYFFYIVFIIYVCILFQPILLEALGIMDMEIQIADIDIY